MKIKYKNIVFFLLTTLFAFISYFFIGTPPRAEEIIFGVNFSQKHAQNFGLNWKKAYAGLLYDLNVRDVKLITFWDLLEKKENEFSFDDLDWQIKQAEMKNANIILVIGMKTGSWPECHIPHWAEGLTKQDQQQRILNLVETIVLRYKQSPAISAWMIENEPFFPFGECPWIDKGFIKQEVEFVKSLDSTRPIIISDSGEWSFWIEAARLGDIIGTTIYKKAWLSEINAYISYPFPPVFYWRKAEIIKKFFNKDVISVELQAEPWCPNRLYNCSFEEQDKTMNLERFNENIEFAKNTGLNKFYLWGAEWWFWLKDRHQDVEIWERARELF
ncbi:MAG: hypothetical protein ACKKMP_01185 [Candidatus Nealsonbacteria bacterium]